MFQLIVAVVAIVLIAVMIVAAIWIGGEVYGESRSKATYAEYLNSAVQIDGALQYYYQERMEYPSGETEEVLQALVDGGYLKSAPPGGWVVSATQLYRPLDPDTGAEECKMLNKVAGKDISVMPCPPCNQAGYEDYPGCMLAAEDS